MTDGVPPEFIEDLAQKAIENFDPGPALAPHPLDEILDRIASADEVDMLDLYLRLPRIVLRPLHHEHEQTPVKARSSFEAGYGDSIRAWKAGIHWLAAVGMLCFFDEVGSALRLADGHCSSNVSVEYCLRSFGGLNEREAAALYALRNALAHDYSLVNPNGKRPELQHAFNLAFDGADAPLVEFPDTPWDGSPTAVQNTIVNLDELMLLGTRVRDAVLAAHKAGRIQLRYSTEETRRRYIFTHEVSVDDWEAQQHADGQFETYEAFRDRDFDVDGS